MLKRIWRGEMGLGWAFWGIGFGGLTFPLAALFFWVMLLPFSALSFGVANLIFICFGVIPTIIVWKSASRTVSKVWGDLAKIYIVISITFGLIVAPVGLIGMEITQRLTPEFYENTPDLQLQASELFRNHITRKTKTIGIDMPEGSKLAHVAYYREGVMDYEFGFHVILNTKDMDLGKWISSAKPFGSNLELMTPKRDLEWNAEGLKCAELDRPEGEYTQPVCNLVNSPRKVWQAEKRLRLDRLVTLTVLEDHNLIWLYETSW